MRIRPRQQLLDLWRSVLDYCYRDGTWVWGGRDGSNSISDAEQLLCLLYPATTLDTFRLDRPDDIESDVASVLAPFGSDTRIGNVLVDLIELLALMPGRDVSWRERPGSLAISPTMAVGVDCRVNMDADGAQRGSTRIVGTVATRVALLGGRILQSSAHTRIVRGADRRRQAWSHYISRKGISEEIELFAPDRPAVAAAMVEGYHGDSADAENVLDLDSASRRLLGRIRTDPSLDQSPPVQVGTTRLRWTAVVGGAAGPDVRLHVDDETVRSVRVMVREETDLDAVQRFCEDLAAHDWLLTVVADALDQADHFDSVSADRLDILEPLVQHFSGLWMPGAHTPKALRTLWRDLQNEPGFTRQWTTLRERLRDEVAVATLHTLRHKDTGW